MKETEPGPLNQCSHPNLRECCPPKDGKPGCGHWHCDDCELGWDDWGEGGILSEPTKAELAQEMRDYED
jgi:hypothetical protein